MVITSTSWRGLLLKPNLFPPVNKHDRRWAEERFFFSTSAKILSECRCSRNVCKGGGTATLTFFTLRCVCETPYVCLSICACVSTKAWPFSRMPRVAQRRSTPSGFPSHPFGNFAVVENWSKSKRLFCYSGEAGGCLSRSRCRVLVAPGSDWRRFGSPGGASDMEAWQMINFLSAIPTTPRIKQHMINVQ